MVNRREILKGYKKAKAPAQAEVDEAEKIAQEIVDRIKFEDSSNLQALIASEVSKVMESTAEMNRINDDPRLKDRIQNRVREILENTP